MFNRGKTVTKIALLILAVVLLCPIAAGASDEIQTIEYNGILADIPARFIKSASPSNYSNYLQGSDQYTIDAQKPYGRVLLFYAVDFSSLEIASQIDQVSEEQMYIVLERFVISQETSTNEGVKLNYSKFNKIRSKINGIPCVILHAVSGNMVLNQIGFRSGKKLINIIYVGNTGNISCDEEFDKIVNSLRVIEPEVKEEAQDTKTDFESIVAAVANDLPQEERWTCPECSQSNSTEFCTQCGAARPYWVCSCGHENVNIFCGQCGKKIDDLLASFNEFYTEYDNGKYDEALRGFWNLGEFNSGSFATRIGDHSSAKEQVLNIQYNRGIALAEAGKYADAIFKFNQLEEDYKDVKTRLEGAYFALGQQQLEKGEYENAISTFEKCKANKQAEKKIKETYELMADDQLSKKFFKKAYNNYVKAGNYTKAKDALYAQGVQLGENRKYEEAIKILEDLNDSAKTKEKLAEYYYLYGKQLLERALKDEKNKGLAIVYDEPITLLVKSRELGYSVEDELLKTAYEAKLAIYRDAKQQDNMIAIIQTAARNGIELDDIVMFEPGGKGMIEKRILGLAAKMGFIKNMPADESEYKEEYRDGVIELEKEFGLTPDGIIMFSESEILSKALYPEHSGFKAVYGYLCDLGLIKIKDVDAKDIYAIEYVKAVKTIEKKLKLKVDGILTPDEQEIVLSQERARPEAVKKVNATCSKGIVTVKWSPAKNALWYEVSRDNVKIADVIGTSYKDTGAEMGIAYSYSVRAKNFCGASESMTTSATVKTEYLSVTPKKLIVDYEAFAGTKYVKISGLYPQEYFREGDDVYLVVFKQNDFICILVENYDSWNWRTTDVVNAHMSSLAVRGFVEKNKKQTNFGMLPLVRADELIY